MWDLILSRLENELGKKTVEKWVRPLKLLRFDAANIHLEAEDSFQVSWFEEHVRPKCLKLVNSNGRPIRIWLTLRTPQAEKKAKSKDVSPLFKVTPDPLDPEMTLENFL